MTDNKPIGLPTPRPESAVDGAAMARLFSPRGIEDDRRPPEAEMMDVVGAYVYAMDPGVARAKRRRGTG